MNALIYRTEEVKVTPKEKADEVAAEMLSREIGLEIIKEDTGIPFRLLSPGEALTLTMLLPRVTNFSEFTKRIPFLVLKAIKDHRDSFKRLLVKADTGREKFALVGHTKGHTWDDGDQCYLLARWSKHPLPTLEELEAEARQAWKNSRRDHLNTAIAKAQYCLATLDVTCAESFKTGAEHEVSFNAW